MRSLFVPLIIAALNAAPAVHSAGSVVTCRDATGRTYVGSPRPRECLLPSDAEREADHDRQASEDAANQDARRVALEERQLLKLYPNDAAFVAAREAELKPIKQRLSVSLKAEERLAAERKPIDVELAFFEKHPVPSHVQDMVDDNTGKTVAQRQISAAIRREIDTVNVRYDSLKIRLQRLWTRRG